LEIHFSQTFWIEGAENEANRKAKEIENEAKLAVGLKSFQRSKKSLNSNHSHRVMSQDYSVFSIIDFSFNYIFSFFLILKTS
jgi:hypothetical protein